MIDLTGASGAWLLLTTDDTRQHYPYHIESVHSYRKKGPGPSNWRPIFQGAWVGCHNRLREILALYDYPLGNPMAKPMDGDSLSWGPVRYILRERIGMLPRIVSRDGLKELPGDAGVYFLVEAESSPVLIDYIGKSSNLRRRWESHTKRSLMESGDYWLYFKAETEHWFSVDFEEFALIAIFRPRLNLTTGRLKLVYTESLGRQNSGY